MLAVSFMAVHGDEGEDHGDGDGQDGNDGARDVPEEDEDDQADNQQFFDERGLERLDGPVDQIRTVVGGDDLHSRRQATLEFGKFRLDPVDNR